MNLFEHLDSDTIFTGIAKLFEHKDGWHDCPGCGRPTLFIRCWDCEQLNKQRQYRLRYQNADPEQRKRMSNHKRKKKVVMTE